MSRNVRYRVSCLARAESLREDRSLSFGKALVASLLLFTLGLVTGCHRTPTISFITVPPEDVGGPDSRGVIAGRVTGSSRSDHIMLFAFNGVWWVQPDVKTQLTPIAKDGSWRAQIHLGLKYAAAVVRGDYSVKASDSGLPPLSGNVLAIDTVDGTQTPISRLDHTARALRFGGHEWENTFHVSEYGGRNHYYLPQNAYVDEKGLHLKIARIAEKWTCSEVKIDRSLGYGTYRVTFISPQELEPAVEFSTFSMDAQAHSDNYREMDIHLSRWGDPRSKNAEYVIQPYYLPANVHRFELPAGQITTTLQWSPGQATFSTQANGKQLTTWKFTAGVPASSSGGRFYFNLCPFGYPRNPLQHEAELVVTQFEYFP